MEENKKELKEDVAVFSVSAPLVLTSVEAEFCTELFGEQCQTSAGTPDVEAALTCSARPQGAGWAQA